MKFKQTYCVVDVNLRILWVGGEWDEFALQNGGKGAVANAILSHRIIQYIADEDTSGVVVDLVNTVIECQRELRIDYRADSPTMMRRFQMTIKPMRDDRTLMVHDLRDARTFTRPLHPWVHSRTAADEKCSFCCSVQLLGGPWQPPELLSGDHPAEVRYRICPDCAGRLREATRAALTGRFPGRPVVNGFGPVE